MSWGRNDARAAMSLQRGAMAVRSGVCPFFFFGIGISHIDPKETSACRRAQEDTREAGFCILVPGWSPGMEFPAPAPLNSDAVRECLQIVLTTCCFVTVSTPYFRCQFTFSS